MKYEDLKYNTPDVFENKFKNSKVLIIGGGHSTKLILDKKEELRNKFDVIIACNYVFQFFDDIVDFHIVTEKTSKTSNNNVYEALKGKDYNLNTVRIVNWKGIELYPQKYNIVKTTRSNFKYNPNIRKYKTNDGEGLLIGPVGKQNFSLGSVMLSALHFSTIIGSDEIYMIGADMCFKDEYDHFYNDSVYRSQEMKKKNIHNIIKVRLNDSDYETTEFFKQSAEYIDKLLLTTFKDIRVYDFSDGLLNTPSKLDIKEFLK